MSVGSISCFIGCLLLWAGSSQGLTFSAFNIKWLTPSKYDKEIVHQYLPQIIKKYDVTLIQELRGDGQNVMGRLAQDLYRITNTTYGYVLSDKIGTTSYKEQYAFIYRQNGSFALREVIQYNDTQGAFEREPYMARFNDPSLSVSDFAIVGIHIKPDHAFVELESLYEDVYNYAASRLGVQEIIFAGDFNADCSYLSASNFNNLQFSTDSKFTWRIDSSEDTTVNVNTNCAYDRFIVTSGINAAVQSVETFDYQASLSLSYDQAKVVSDHYPISMKLT